MLWNEIKIRISIVEREIVNKLSIFLITRKKLNVNPRMLAIRFVMKEKKNYEFIFANEIFRRISICPSLWWQEHEGQSF